MIEHELDFFAQNTKKLATPAGTPDVETANNKTTWFSPKPLVIGFIGLNIALLAYAISSLGATTVSNKQFLNLNTVVKVSDVENAKDKPVLTEQDAKLYFINQRLEEQKAADARKVRIGALLWE